MVSLRVRCLECNEIYLPPVKQSVRHTHENEEVFQFQQTVVCVRCLALSNESKEQPGTIEFLESQRCLSRYV